MIKKTIELEKKSEKKIKGSSFRFFEKKIWNKIRRNKKVHAAAWTSVFLKKKSFPLFFKILDLKKRFCYIGKKLIWKKSTKKLWKKDLKKLK